MVGEKCNTERNVMENAKKMSEVHTDWKKNNFRNIHLEKKWLLARIHSMFGSMNEF